jgi:hypothetical protein
MSEKPGKHCFAGHVKSGGTMENKRLIPAVPPGRI